MTDHVWQINSNFGAFRVENGEVDLDNKAPDNNVKNFQCTFGCRAVKAVKRQPTESYLSLALLTVKK